MKLSTYRQKLHHPGPVNTLEQSACRGKRGRKPEPFILPDQPKRSWCVKSSKAVFLFTALGVVSKCARVDLSATICDAGWVAPVLGKAG